MSVTEARRLSLLLAARRHLGKEEGETLMELVVPAGAEIATRSFVLTTVLSVVLSVALAQTALTVSLIVLLQR